MPHSTPKPSSDHKQPTFLTLPLELRQQILHLTLMSSLSWDPVFWSDAVVSQERYIATWANTLKLVHRRIADEVGWVEKRWMGRLEREREERFRVWWGNLAVICQ
jgi:hypothetical protein